MPIRNAAVRRSLVYLLIAASLLVLFILSRPFQWYGSSERHTLMETMAMMFALMTGCLALMRYYSRQHKSFLLIGAAFIGTAFLDGYHATISSDFVGQYLPSASQSVIPWSWLASRVFISIFLFLGWLTWYTHRNSEDSIWEHERFVYGIATAFTLTCFLFFVLTPLPSGYSGGGSIHRPAEYVAALFFLLALVGHLKKGAWKHDSFEHWLILSLLLNLGAQVFFMPTSADLFDLGFEAAHILKQAAYVAVLIGLLIDMYGVFSDERLLKQKLRESEAKHRTIIESSHDVIIRYGKDGRFTYLNPAAALEYGCDPESFIGLRPSDLSLPADLCAMWEGAVEAVFATGRPHSLNYETNAASGPVTVDWKAFPECDTDGRVESVVSVSRDITQFKQREEEARRLHKLESIGLMAGGVAHDFNNILVGLFGNISLAKSSLPSNHDAYGHLERAEQAFKRASNLTKQFLTFAEGGKPLKTVVRLERIIEEVVHFNLANTETTVRFRFEEGIWPILADEGQMAQVIANLTINASQSMNEAGNIFINLVNAVVSQSENSQHEARKFVRLVIRDQGVGIKPEHLDRIFDPYFSTKHTGRGLGLATVYSIVRQHEGNIYVKSTPGLGTSFTLLLPACPEAMTSEAPAAPAPMKPRKARILVMDDDEMVLNVTVSLLKKIGHEVDLARDGLEAIRKYQEAFEAGSAYDCLIMDLTVPEGMGGKDAMAEILRFDPGAKGLVASGYATDPVMANFRQYGFAGVIPKPFTMGSLKDAVSGVLNPGPAAPAQAKVQ